MARNAPRLPMMALVIFLAASPAHAAAGRAGASSLNVRAAPVVNQIDGLSLSSSVAAVDGTVRVTVTGTGSCLTRIDNGGVQISQGKAYADIPGGFPKFLSLTVQGAPGSYLIQAQNANPRDSSCTGAVSATLIVTGGTPAGRAAPAAGPSNSANAAPPTVAARREPANNAVTDPCALSAREQAARGVTCPVPATPVTSLAPAAGSSNSANAAPPPVAARLEPVNNAVTDPCALSAREQAARGVTCPVPATPVTPLAPQPGPSNSAIAPPSTVAARLEPVNNAVTDPCALSAREETARDVTCAAQATRMPAKSVEVPVLKKTFPGIASNERISSPESALISAGVIKSVAAKRKSDAYEPGQLVILWDDANDGIKGLQILARDYKVQPVQRTELRSLGGLLATFQLRDNKLAALLRDLLRQQYPGWHVDLNAQYQSLGGPRIYLQTKIGAPATTPSLPHCRVGILDTAVTPIAALQATSLTQRSFLADTDAPSSTEHGTAIATLISGQDRANNFRALAVGAQLFIGAIMRDQMGESRSNTATFLRGLDWLIGKQVQVVNLSLGGPGDDLLASVFARLRSKGIIIVASAGNGGPNAAPSYPAAYRGVLAVTAVDALDQSYREANNGTYIALAAPGVDVWTPDAASGHYVSGTSFSAAVVTGAIGLMLSYRGDLTSERVRAGLCRNARDLGVPGFDPVYGCGLLQIGRTLAAPED